MLSLEEILYMSLAAGLLVGLAVSRGPGKGVRAVDLISTASILALVFSMGLVVCSELISIRGQAITIVVAFVAIAVLPGLLGSLIAEALVRRLEGGA